MNKRTPEQQRADYQASHDAQQRDAADPERMAFLRRKIAELEERTPPCVSCGDSPVVGLRDDGRCGACAGVDS